MKIEKYWGISGIIVLAGIAYMLFNVTDTDWGHMFFLVGWIVGVMLASYSYRLKNPVKKVENEIDC